MCDKVILARASKNITLQNQTGKGTDEIMTEKGKEIKEKERTVYAVGRPDLAKLSKEEQRAFFDTLLRCIVDYYKERNEGV